MDRKYFLSLAGFGATGLCFTPHFIFSNKKKVAVLYFGSNGDPMLIDDFCLESNIKCYYLDVNRRRAVPDDSNHIIFGKQVKEYYEYGFYRISLVSAADEILKCRDDFIEFFDWLKKQRSATDIIMVANTAEYIPSIAHIACFADEKELKVHAIMFSFEFWEGIFKPDEMFALEKAKLKIKKFSENLLIVDPEREIYERYGRELHEVICPPEDEYLILKNFGKKIMAMNFFERADELLAEKLENIYYQITSS